MEKIINIATALNEKYIPYTYVMLYSLFENNPENSITVYLLQDHFSEDKRDAFSSLTDAFGERVRFVFLNIQKELLDQRLMEAGDWSIEACFRLQLFDLLPDDVERILYLDGDMIINKSITDLYNTDFGEKHLVVCHDMTMTPDSGSVYGYLHTETFNRIIRENQYFNSGMILMDVAYLKQHYRAAYYFQAARDLNYQIYAPDQDLLNYVHLDDTKFVDEWTYDLFACNAFIRNYDYETVRKKTVILHYVGHKPWSSGDHIHYEVERLWWDYARKTKYAAELVLDFIRNHLKRDSATKKTLHSIEEKNEVLWQNLARVTDILKSFGKTVALPERKRFQDRSKPFDPNKVYQDPTEYEMWKERTENDRLNEALEYIKAVISSKAIEEYLKELTEENEMLDREINLRIQGLKEIQWKMEEKTDAME